MQLIECFFSKNILGTFKLFCFFWLRCTACAISVPPPGIEPVPSAVKAWSPNHWIAGEFPRKFKMIYVDHIILLDSAGVDSGEDGWEI